jgi:hypothetical protein
LAFHDVQLLCQCDVLLRPDCVCGLNRFAEATQPEVRPPTLLITLALALRSFRAGRLPIATGVNFIATNQYEDLAPYLKQDAKELRPAAAAASGK